MSKSTFQTYICKPYCVFFQKGEKEEMACQGAMVAERLVHNNKFSPLDVSAPSFKKGIPFKEDETLLRLVCEQCPFEEQDCDFRSPSPPEGAVPCGGYILLFLLTSKGLLSVKDLEEACIEEH